MRSSVGEPVGAGGRRPRGGRSTSTALAPSPAPRRRPDGLRWSRPIAQPVTGDQGAGPRRRQGLGAPGCPARVERRSTAHGDAVQQPGQRRPSRRVSAVGRTTRRRTHHLPRSSPPPDRRGSSHTVIPPCATTSRPPKVTSSALPKPTQGCRASGWPGTGPARPRPRVAARRPAPPGPGRPGPARSVNTPGLITSSDVDLVRLPLLILTSTEQHAEPRHEQRRDLVEVPGWSGGDQLASHPATHVGTRR